MSHMHSDERFAKCGRNGTFDSAALSSPLVPLEAAGWPKLREMARVKISVGLGFGTYSLDQDDLRDAQIRQESLQLTCTDSIF